MWEGRLGQLKSFTLEVITNLLQPKVTEKSRGMSVSGSAGSRSSKKCYHFSVLFSGLASFSGKVTDCPYLHVCTLAHSSPAGNESSLLPQ